MLSKKAKKLLSVILVIALLAVSALQIGVIPASAEATLPVYDSNAHTQIYSVSTAMLQNSTAEFYNFPDTSAAGTVYSSIKVTTTTNLPGYFSPYIMLAETDYKESETDTDTWYLGMRLMGANGYWIGLLNSQAQTMAIYDGQTYPNGSLNLPQESTITTKLENGTASVWIDDKNVITDYSNAAYNITKLVAGGCINGYGYYLVVNVWRDKVEAPVMDAATQIVSSTYASTQVTSGTASFFEMKDIIDDQKAVYTSLNIEKTTNYSGWFSPYIMLAETDYKSSETDTATWYLGLRLTGSYGYSVCLLNNQTQAQWIYDGKAYPDGTNNLSSLKITYKTEGGKISLWVGDNEVLFDYSNSNYNILKPVVGGCINGYGYWVSGSTWIDKDNYAKKTPTFDPETQAKMINHGEVVSGGTLNKYDAYYVEDYYAPIYTEYTVQKFDFVTGWFSPCIAIAETDYVSGDNEYYLGIRMTPDYGYSICLMDKDMNQKEYVLDANGNAIDGATYPDTGSSKMSNNPYKITVKTYDGLVSVWMNDTCILEDYSNDEAYTIMGPAASGYINGYSFQIHIDSWTAIDNYNRLGELNGDAKINILDFIIMKKIAAGVEGSAAINDLVIALDGDATEVSTSEIIAMQKYLLGVIEAFEGYDYDYSVEYGYDTVSALELL